MDESDAKRRATGALITRMIEALDLERVDSLPMPVYGFQPTDDWFLFRVRGTGNHTGPDEYVSINRDEGTVRFLGALGG